jgi:hypothetical protein
VYWTHYHAGAWVTDHGGIWSDIVWKNGVPAPELGWQGIETLGTTEIVGYHLPSGPEWIADPAAVMGYDMADCWASCMIPFDWGLQYDPRGFVYVSEMVTGLYVIQFDEDKDPRFNYPRQWTPAE